MIHLIPKAAINVVIDLWPMILLFTITIISIRLSLFISKHKKIELAKEMINLVFVIYIMLLFNL